MYIASYLSLLSPGHGRILAFECDITTGHDSPRYLILSKRPVKCHSAYLVVLLVSNVSAAYYNEGSTDEGLRCDIFGEVVYDVE